MTSRFDLEVPMVAAIVALAVGMSLGLIYAAAESHDRMLVECVRHHSPKECEGL